MSSWEGPPPSLRPGSASPPAHSAGSSLTPQAGVPCHLRDPETPGQSCWLSACDGGAEGSHLSPGFQTSGRSTANKETRAPGWPAAPLTHPRPSGSTPSRLAPLPAAGPVVLELGLDWRTVRLPPHPSSGSCPPPPGSTGLLGPRPRCGCARSAAVCRHSLRGLPSGGVLPVQGRQEDPLGAEVSLRGSTHPPRPFLGGAACWSMTSGLSLPSLAAMGPAWGLGTGHTRPWASAPLRPGLPPGALSLLPTLPQLLPNKLHRQSLGSM